mmetsp:Transcript_16290/g.16224  ORF Transcript_16290/g.16224 Transcript_16290/m.16224 type:complete len:111 (-) Transcript_16290:357-689(-)
MLSHKHSSSFSSEDYSKQRGEMNLSLSDIVIEDDYLLKKEYFTEKIEISADKKIEEPAHELEINEKENLPEFEKNLEKIDAAKPKESNFILVGDSPLLSPKKILGSRNLA